MLLLLLWMHKKLAMMSSQIDLRQNMKLLCRSGYDKKSTVYFLQTVAV